VVVCPHLAVRGGTRFLCAETERHETAMIVGIQLREIAPASAHDRPNAAGNAKNFTSIVSIKV
jgi:hypothetical protein